MRIRKDRDVRLKEILDCAETLFASKGYDKTSVNDILKAVDIGKGTFYYYFESKESLMYAVIKHVLARYCESLDVILKDNTLNALEKFIRITLGNMPKAQYTQNFIIDLQKQDNSSFQQISTKEGILLFTPILTEVIMQGIAEGIFNTPYPKETVEQILTINWFLFNQSLFGWTLEDIKPRLRAFTHNIELLLDVKKGSFDYMIEAYLRR